MSLLLVSESSTARFSVSNTGTLLAAGAAVSCARAAPAPIIAANSPHAMPGFQAMPLPPIFLLIAQRLDGLERRRLPRRQPAEKQSRGTRNQEGHTHAESRNRHAQVPGQKLLRRHGYADADQDADHRAAAADQKRL